MEWVAVLAEDALSTEERWTSNPQPARGSLIPAFLDEATLESEFERGLPYEDAAFATHLGVKTGDLQWIARTLMHATLPPGVDTVLVPPKDRRLDACYPFQSV